MVLSAHQAPALSAQFSRSGDASSAPPTPGIVRVTPCEVCGSMSSVLRLARTRAGRELSAVERQRLLPQDD